MANSVDFEADFSSSPLPNDSSNCSSSNHSHQLSSSLQELMVCALLWAVFIYCGKRNYRRIN